MHPIFLPDQPADVLKKGSSSSTTITALGIEFGQSINGCIHLLAEHRAMQILQVSIPESLSNKAPNPFYLPKRIRPTLASQPPQRLYITIYPPHPSRLLQPRDPAVSPIDQPYYKHRCIVVDPYIPPALVSNIPTIKPPG
jgi:hypothetical protein